MATDVVPDRASRGSILDMWWWLRLLLRTTLALLAFMLLGLGNDRFGDWIASANGGAQPLDNSIWLAGTCLFVGAGVLFGLAAWLPFTKIRYLPSRLALALLALLPVGHLWWTFIRPMPVPTLRPFPWYDNFELQYVFAVLAGVAIASGFRSRIPKSGSRPRET